MSLKRTYWSGELLLLDDVAENPQFSNDDYLRDHRPRSILCLPLWARGRSIGLLYLESR